LLNHQNCSQVNKSHRVPRKQRPTHASIHPREASEILRIGLFFGFTDQISGIVVAMLFVSLPFLVNAAREAFGGVELELEQMAALLGASRWEVFCIVARAAGAARLESIIR
jgi:ABC-type sulfate transport system permease component